jgi:hypothetical protein
VNVRVVGRGRVRVDVFARRASSRRRWSLLAVIGLVVVIVNVVVVHDLVSTHAHAARLRHDQTFTATQVRTHQEGLATALSNVDATAAALAGRTDERDQQRASVASKAMELGAARVDLGAAVAHLAQQVGQITILTTCLQGVSSAMNGLSVGDGAHGLGALRAVEEPCHRAATFGAAR